LRTRHQTIALVGALVLVMVALEGCCSEDSRQVGNVMFSQPVCLTPAGRREFQLTHEGRRYEYPDVENANGTITRVIWVQDGQGAALRELLKGHATFQAVTADHKPTMFKDALPSGQTPSVSSTEALILTGSRDNVNGATELVNQVLTSLPQIEIEARIVEVREDDDFALGTDLFLQNLNHPFDPAQPNAPGVDLGRTNFGIPDFTGVPPVLLKLGTITDGLQLDMMISAMKMLTKTDVLSAPRIAVLNGFKAEFSAGEDVPILKQNVVGTTVTITTEFRPVGIKLIVVPSLVSRDIVRMSVKTKVENIIGTTPIFTGTVVTPSPIISVREATTTVDVRDGAAVVIGGLFTTSKSDKRDRVPVLGELPLLGMFFGTTRQQEGHTNLLFFIRPRLISPGGEGGAVITPPATDLLPDPAPSCPPSPCPPNPCPPACPAPAQPAPAPASQPASQPAK
jgi:type II secretory pathway component GspD/PulD (secretin)